MTKELPRDAHIMQMLEGYDLSIGEKTYALLLRLPTGQRITCAVDRASYRELETFYELSPNRAEEPAQPRKNGAAQEPVPPPMVEQEEAGSITKENQEALQQRVQWELLPEETLPSLLKRAMRSLRVPPVLTVEEVYNVASELHNKLTQEDWAKLEYQESQERTPAPPLPPQPVMGAVNWSDGSPIVPAQRTPGKKVGVDAKGNPVLNGSDVDPGELVSSDGDDVDEDGVASW